MRDRDHVARHGQVSTLLVSANELPLFHIHLITAQYAIIENDGHDDSNAYQSTSVRLMTEFTRSSTIFKQQGIAARE
jgi:hypothetical protein